MRRSHDYGVVVTSVLNADSSSSRYESVQRAYDTVAADYAALLPDTRAEAPIDLAMVDAFIAAVGTGSRVLDAGCGTGRMSRYLADREVSVEGVDLSPGMVAIASKHHPDLTFTVGSISDLPYEDQSFDGVMLWYSTIHTTRDGQARLYREASRVLRVGGRLLVAFQAGKGIHDTSQTYRRYGHDVDLVRYRFTPDEAAEWMTASGLLEVFRMVRRPEGKERDSQAVLMAEKPEEGARDGLSRLR